MKTINENFTIDGNVDLVYEAFVNPKKLAKITGEKASNDMKEGGKFTAYSNYITGKNLELIPGKKIVWEWSCEDLPKGTLVKATIDLKKLNERQSEISFILENIPDEYAEDLKEGWKMFYFDPIKDHFEELLWA